MNTNIGQKIKRVTKSSYNNTLVRHIGLLEVPKLERLGEVLKEVVQKMKCMNCNCSGDVDTIKLS